MNLYKVINTPGKVEFYISSDMYKVARKFPNAIRIQDKGFIKTYGDFLNAESLSIYSVIDSDKEKICVAANKTLDILRKMPKISSITFEDTATIL